MVGALSWLHYWCYWLGFEHRLEHLLVVLFGGGLPELLQVLLYGTFDAVRYIRHAGTL